MKVLAFFRDFGATDGHRRLVIRALDCKREQEIRLPTWLSETQLVRYLMLEEVHKNFGLHHVERWELAREIRTMLGYSITVDALATVDAPALQPRVMTGPEEEGMLP